MIAAAERSTPPAACAEPGVGRVLVLDDAQGQGAWARILRADHRALAASRPSEALVLLEEYPVELVIADLDHVGDGDELATRVRRLRPGVELIFTQAGAAAREPPAEAFDLLSKPLESVSARRRVQQALRVRRLEEENRVLRARAERQAAVVRAQALEVEGDAGLRRSNESLVARNAELDAFAHTVAHALKTPLLGLKGLVDALERMHEAGRADLTRRIRRSADRMASCIDELLLLARTRSEPVTPVPLDMGELVDRACERVAHLVDARAARVELPPAWPVAVGHGPWVEEVWFNLLSNGVKYGGHPPRLQLGGELAGDHARFWVRDNGEGLKPSDRARLFQPFTRFGRGPAEGYGLGLSIVERIVTRLGGAVSVESEPFRGSCFAFTLPRA